MTAAELILRKALVGSDLDSSQWTRIQAGLKNRAFFSSQVAEAGILAALREREAEFAERGVDASEFRKLIRRDLEALKYQPKPGEENTIKDLFSKARLDAILETNEAQARGWIEHAQGMSAGAFAAFPAQEFTRVENRDKPRLDWPLRWARAGGRVFGGRMIALKDDQVWQNLGDAGPFGNPYPPFDWGSGMGVMDIDRDEAVQLGLIDDATLRGKVDGLRDKPIPDFNAGLQAAVPMEDGSPEAARLKDIFGDQVRFDGNVAHWQGELIGDVLDGSVRSAKLGRGYDGRNLSISHNIFAQHISKHFGENEKDPRNMPLSRGDFELLPAMWRDPDDVARERNRDHLTFETFDGGILNLIVDAVKGIVGFWKMKNPKGA